MRNIFFTFLISYVVITSAQITSYERPDGSYSLGYSSSGHGNVGEALEGLLTYASGWTENEDNFSADIPSLYSLIESKQARGAFTTAMNTLVGNIQKIFRQNSEVLGVIKRVTYIIIEYFRYIGGAVVNQLRDWVSPSRQQIGYFPSSNNFNVRNKYSFPYTYQ